RRHTSSDRDWSSDVCSSDLSSGFGEVETGRELERQLRDAALAAGLPVCGPNGNGIVAVGARAPMWGDSVAPLDEGGVALISQSRSEERRGGKECRHGLAVAR